MTYTMNIETGNGVHQYPYHLGTVRHVAESIVMEQLRHHNTLSIALYNDGKLVRIFDYMDLPEYVAWLREIDALGKDQELPEPMNYNIHEECL